MKTNPIITTCVLCTLPIPANGGIISERGPMHLICRAKGRAGTTGYEVSQAESGRSAIRIQNADGLCEDAPCCGCCGVVPIPQTVEMDLPGAMALLFDEDGPDDSPEIDLDTIPAEELAEHEFAKIKIPDGIDLTAPVPEIEDALEARFKIEERTGGTVCIAICSERSGLVARLLAS